MDPILNNNDQDQNNLIKLRQARFINVSFSLMLMAFVIGILANVLLTQNLVAIVMLSIFLFVNLALMGFHHFKKKYDVTSTILNIFVLISFLVYLHIAEQAVFVLYLFPAIPVVSLYLSGLFKGTIYSVATFTITVLYIIVIRDGWDEIIFQTGSLMNFLVGSLGLFCLIYLYEINIRDVQKQLQKNNVHLHTLATTDSLTKLYNRDWLEKTLQQKIAQKESFCILISDLDNFKTINDNFGHTEGDRVLKTLAQHFKTTKKTNTHVGRWGGDEFLIICDDTNIKESLSMAEVFRAKCNQFLKTFDTSVSISFGVASFKKDDSLNTLLQRADKGLYKSKNGGKNKASTIETVS